MMKERAEDDENQYEGVSADDAIQAPLDSSTSPAPRGWMERRNVRTGCPSTVLHPQTDLSIFAISIPISKATTHMTIVFVSIVL